MAEGNNNHSNYSTAKNPLKKKVEIVSNLSLQKKITGILLAIFGVILLINGYFNNTVYFINLGIGLIVIGWILLIFSYERYIKYDITSNVLNDYMDIIKKLIKELNIETDGIVIPPKENLKDGCIYLPLHRDFKINFSLIDDSTLFVNSDNRDEMGIILPPLGKGLIKLLKKYRGEYNVPLKEKNDIEELLEYLDYFLTLFQVGNNIEVKIHNKDIVIISYRIVDNSLCKKLQREELCNKCPCPICGAIVLIIAEFLNEALKIESIVEKNKIVTIKLKIIRNILK